MTRSLADIQRVAAFRASLRRFERTTERAVRTAGLTPRQYLLLVAIEGSPGGTRRAQIGEIADALQLAPSTTSELVGRAAAAGIVRRVSATRDARVVGVSLTATGRRRLEKAMAALDAERDAVAAAAETLRQQLP